MKKFSTSNQKEKFTKKDPFFRVFKRFLTLFFIVDFPGFEHYCLWLIQRLLPQWYQ